MEVKIIEQPLTLDIFGFSGVAADKRYGAKAFELSGRMWNTVKSHGLKNKGQNIWVYEDGHAVFAGVELEEAPPVDSGLERKTISLSRYGYCKHIGPYSLMGQSSDNLRQHIRQHGLHDQLPFIEVYGHWNSDESKLETEMITAIG